MPAPPTPAPIEPAAAAAPTVGVWRRRRGVIAVLTLLAVLYAGLVAAYAVAEGSGGLSTADRTPPAGGVLVLLNVRSVDAASASMKVDVSVLPSAELLADDVTTAATDIRLSVWPTPDGADQVFPAGKQLDTRQETISFDGDIQNWPLDTYSSTVEIFATAGTGSAAAEIPVAAQWTGAAQGWDLSAAQTGDRSDQSTFDVQFRRSIAIILFGLTLLAVLVMLPVTSWVVGLRLYREDRLFEAGFLGWIAAMLFATIPIRNFFPGSPPPGSWVDVLVVLWVIVALTVALVLGLTAFIKHPRLNH